MQSVAQRENTSRSETFTSDHSRQENNSYRAATHSTAPQASFDNRKDEVSVSEKNSHSEAASFEPNIDASSETACSQDSSACQARTPDEELKSRLLPLFATYFGEPFLRSFSLELADVDASSGKIRSYKPGDIKLSSCHAIIFKWSLQVDAPNHDNRA